MRIGFAAYLNKNGSACVREKLVHCAQDAGVDCAVYDDAEAIKADPSAPDVLTVVGGDGSLLRYAHAASERNIPVLGINQGRIGFLSEIAADEFPAALKKLKDGAYSTEQRMMLACRIGACAELFCLNDFMVFKQSFSGIAQIEIELNEMRIGTVYCDGIIVATPTGSTAYTLSAGGPVIAPGLEAIAVTPVCPHTLHFRPFVASPDDRVRVRVIGRGIVSADGMDKVPVGTGDEIVITRARRSAQFIRFGQKNVFELIQTKLS